MNLTIWSMLVKKLSSCYPILDTPCIFSMCDFILLSKIMYLSMSLLAMFSFDTTYFLSSSSGLTPGNNFPIVFPSVAPLSLVPASLELPFSFRVSPTLPWRLLAILLLFKLALLLDRNFYLCVLQESDYCCEPFWFAAYYDFITDAFSGLPIFLERACNFTVFLAFSLMEVCPATLLLLVPLFSEPLLIIPLILLCCAI